MTFFLMTPEVGIPFGLKGSKSTISSISFVVVFFFVFAGIRMADMG